MAAHRTAPVLRGEPMDTVVCEGSATACQHAAAVPTARLLLDLKTWRRDIVP